VSLRSSTIYVEPKTVRRLILVTKLYPERVIGDSGMATRDKSADERADSLINEAIGVKYPKVIELEKLLTKTEKDFLTGVQQQTTKGQ
jgi:hypothetical protein